MSVSFDGIPEAGVAFLAKLKENNTKDWFQANRKIYEKELRAPMVELVEAVGHELEGFAPEYAPPNPSKALSRINRDIRFSANKAPYNTQMSAVLSCRGAKKSDAAGFFFGISPEGVDLVGGVYMPGPPQLRAIRERWAEDGDAFLSIAGEDGLTRLMGSLQAEQLKRVPRGYAPDHPAADLLRNKQAYFRSSLPPELASTPDLLPALIERFRAMTPFVRYLDEAIAGVSVA